MNRDECYRLIANNPVAGAHFFHFMIENFIKHVLGDEHSKSHPTLVLGLVVFWAALSLCSSPLPLTLPTFLSLPLCQ